MAKGGLNLLAAQLLQAGHKDFNAQAAYQAINAGDEVALEQILGTLPTDRARIRLSSLFDEGQKLLKKHEELTANAPEALKAIQERQSQAEKQAQEQTKAEVGRIGSHLSEQVALRFPFLKGVEGDKNLNDALAQAKEAMEKFDVVNASPQERAEAAHARAYAPIIAARQEMIIQDQQRQLEAKDEEHATVEKELREQIAALEERLGNQNGEASAVAPGHRDANGKFASKPTKASDIWRANMAGKS